MVKRGYFKGREFPVNHAPDSILMTGAFLNNSDWAAHISLCVDGKEIKRKELFGFATIEEALIAANSLASSMALEGRLSFDDDVSGKQ
jgi:hypothetical protein